MKNEKSREDLVLENVNLIYFVLKQMNLYQQTDYYYDIGLIGLVKAANNFNEDKKMAFSTFAAKCIRHEIWGDIRHNNALQRKSNKNTISLDTIIGHDEDNDSTLKDLIPSDFNLEDYVIEREKRRLVREAIRTLHPNERRLLRLIYGPEEFTQVQVAKMYNTTQSNISRKIKKIIKKLQNKIKYEGDTR